MKLLWCLALIWAGLTVGVARANDSLIEAPAGGIVLTKTADIDMRAEDLRITRDVITVRYDFFNKAPADITSDVAFPLPEIQMGREEPRDVASGLPADNFVGFSVSVDGRAVAAVLQERAILADGRDVTAILKANNIPLTYFADAGKPWYASIEALPPATRRTLIADGVLGPGAAGDDDAQWTVKSLFRWRQTFPAGRVLTVAHRYYPVLGAYWYGLSDAKGPSIAPPWDGFCIDDGTRAALRKMLAAQPADMRYLRGWVVDYVLTTGANWAGPIGRFKLTVEKPDADAILSTCLDGLKKTGPTTFVLERRNFTPARDLKFAFFMPYREGEVRRGRIETPQ